MPTEIDVEVVFWNPGAAAAGFPEIEIGRYGCGGYREEWLCRGICGSRSVFVVRRRLGAFGGAGRGAIRRRPG